MATHIVRSVAAGVINRPITVIQLIRGRGGLSLADAKARVDNFLGGVPFSVEVASAEDARTFAVELAHLGILCVVYSEGDPERRYEWMPEPTPALAKGLLFPADPSALGRLSIALSLHSDDLEWATSSCLQLAKHADDIARGNAILGLGHLARRFGRLDERCRKTIAEGLTDPAAWVRGHACSAAEDVRQFLGWEIGSG